MVDLAAVTSRADGPGGAAAEAGDAVALAVRCPHATIALDATGGDVTVALQAERAVPAVEEGPARTLAARQVAEPRFAAHRVASACCNVFYFLIRFSMLYGNG